MDGSMDENLSYGDGGNGRFSPMSSQNVLRKQGSNDGFPPGSSRSTPFENNHSGNPRMQQPISPQNSRNLGHSGIISPPDAAFQYYGSNSGFSSGNVNVNSRSQGQLSGSYLSSNLLHNQQDVYGSVGGNVQYDSSFTGGWSNSISRSSSQSGINLSTDQHQQGNRANGMNAPSAGYPQNMNLQHDWQGARRMGSHDSQVGDMVYVQNQNSNYNSSVGGDYNTQSPGMIIIGMGQQQQQSISRSNSNNRFTSSQMSQMGGGQGQSGGSGTKSSNSCQNSTGGSNAQGRALNKMLLEILRDRMVDPNRLAMAIDANIERMDCVNLATLLFHTGKKRLLLTPSFIKRIAARFNLLKEELRAREASNALYGLKCMSSECVEVRQLIFALATKVAGSNTELVAQAVGNALYGCQMMTSDHEEVRYLLQVLSVKVNQCTELLEAQNVGNALYGLRGMGSDYKEGIYSTLPFVHLILYKSL